MDKYFSVAIDGPSGAGKSTIAKMCAEKLGFLYVDTGAIYRTVGLAAKRAGIASKDAEGVSALLPGLDITMCHDESGLQRMVLCGDDVTEEIRMPEVSIYASDVSAMPHVRAFLLEMQRGLAQTHNVIMDGRDIGTVVLPDAELKIFLTAQPEERAKRRYDELLIKGVKTTYEEVLKDIQYRDKNDSSRSSAPLKPAENAVMIDTTGNSLEESFRLICGIIEERMAK
ncbi:MAG: (d)CMP kinase [Clostridiales bacterium]|jgi:cytidylate kinase|nr:(d)CMP kinase [Clostridiales bacterium]